MLFRILKYIFLIIVIFVITIFVYLKSDNENKVFPFIKSSNSAKSIVYTFNVNGGKFEICAKEVSVGNNLSSFVLKDMNAHFISVTRNIEIKSKKCKLFPGEKLAFFGPAVEVKSKDLFFTTNAAVLNWKENTLSGDSKLSGYNGKLKFSADGFLIKEKQKIILKHAKIIKDPK